MQEILKFNVKKENNLGVDILFNRPPTYSEISNLEDCLNNIFTSEANKESPKHFYIGLDDLMHINNPVVYVLDELLKYGLENDLSIDCNNCTKDVYYAIDKYKNSDYSVWNLKTIMTDSCLISCFNYRLHDYLVSKGFENISKSIYEHSYSEKGFKHIKNILKSLKISNYYKFKENILIIK